MDIQNRQKWGYLFSGLGLIIPLYLLYMGFFYQWNLFFQDMSYLTLFIVLIVTSIGSLIISFFCGDQELRSWLYSLISFYILAFSWVIFTFIYGFFWALVWIGIWSIPISLAYVLLIKGIQKGKKWGWVAKMIKILPVLIGSIFVLFFLILHI